MSKGPKRTQKESKAVERALRIRSKMKSAKPNFVRYESWRYVRLSKPWRNPRGLDNKARLKMKGWETTPRIGYRSPRLARNLHPSGYREIIVHNLTDLEKVDPKEYAVRIAHQVGTKKRMSILGKAEELGLRVLNPVSEIVPAAGEVEPKGEEKEGKKEETKKETMKKEAKKEEAAKKKKEGKAKKQPEKAKKKSQKEKERKK